MFGAVSAAEHSSVRLQTVSDDPTLTATAERCQKLDGALETVKGVPLAIHFHNERFVVVVPASVTFWHSSTE